MARAWLKVWLAGFSRPSSIATFMLLIMASSSEVSLFCSADRSATRVALDCIDAAKSVRTAGSASSFGHAICDNAFSAREVHFLLASSKRLIFFSPDCANTVSAEGATLPSLSAALASCCTCELTPRYMSSWLWLGGNCSEATDQACEISCFCAMSCCKLSNAFSSLTAASICSSRLIRSG